MDPIAPLHTRQKLKLLGFLENEVNILTLLFLRKKLSTKDISQQTSLSYDVVHYSLTSLEKKKLISRVSSKGDDMVEICSDQEFLNWIDKQRGKNAAVYNDAKDAIEGYLQTIGESTWKPNVMYFEGKQGILDIYEDMLQTGKDIYCWTNIDSIYECLGDYMLEFIDRRVEAGITTHSVLPDTPRNRERQEHGEMREGKLSKCLPIDGEIRIYGDKVAVITFENDKPVGFVFNGKVIAAVFRAIFEHAWSRTEDEDCV